MVLAECLLHGMKLVGALGQALDRRHLTTLGLDGEDRARLDRLAVEMDDAGAALAGVAADMGAGKAKMLAQELDQQRAGLDLPGSGLAIDGHRDIDGHHYSPSDLWFVALQKRAARALVGLWQAGQAPVKRIAGQAI